MGRCGHLINSTARVKKGLPDTGSAATKTGYNISTACGIHTLYDQPPYEAFQHQPKPATATLDTGRAATNMSPLHARPR